MLSELLARNRSAPPLPDWLPQDQASPLDPGDEGSAAATNLDALPAELHLSGGLKPWLKLVGALPADFGGERGNWGAVRVLCLSDNELTDLPDLHRFENLHTLWLDHNLLEHVRAEALPRSLVDLALHDNAGLLSLPADLEKCCPLLQRVRLDRCVLLKAPLPTLPKSLKSVHLQGCAGLVDVADGDDGQTKLAMDLVAQLPKLEDLQMPAGGVHFSADDPDGLRKGVMAHFDTVAQGTVRNKGGSSAPVETALPPHHDFQVQLLYALVFIDAFGPALTMPLVVHHWKELGGSPVQYGLLGGFMNAVQFVGAPISGWLSDRHGTQRLLPLGMAAAALGAALGAGATGSAGLWWLVIARLPAALLNHSGLQARAALAAATGPRGYQPHFAHLNSVGAVALGTGAWCGGALIGDFQIAAAFAAAASLCGAIGGFLLLARAPSVRVSGAAKAGESPSRSPDGAVCEAQEYTALHQRALGAVMLMRAGFVFASVASREALPYIVSGGGVAQVGLLGTMLGAKGLVQCATNSLGLAPLLKRLAVRNTTTAEPHPPFTHTFTHTHTTTLPPLLLNATAAVAVWRGATLKEPWRTCTADRWWLSRGSGARLCLAQRLLLALLARQRLGDCAFRRHCRRGARDGHFAHAAAGRSCHRFSGHPQPLILHRFNARVSAKS